MYHPITRLAGNIVDAPRQLLSDGYSSAAVYDPARDMAVVSAEVERVGEAPESLRLLHSTLLGTILLILGSGVLAWNYGAILPRPANYIFFWVAIGLCLLGTLIIGLQRKAGAWSHAYALAILGATLWLPYFLRSPTRLIFQDELYHYQIVQLMIERGHTNVPVTFFPIPGDFPGLELSTLGLMATTGLSIDVAVRVIALLAHVLIPLLAYLIGRGVGLGRKGGFISALIYITNTSYFFFHSIFSYETLGIVMVLTVWALATRRFRGMSWRDFPLTVLVLIATTATHHASSYVLAAMLVTAWLTRRHFAEQQKDALGTVALLGVVIPVVWLILRGSRVISYLVNSFGSPIRSTFYALTDHTSRHLFTASTLPSLERLVDRAYPVLLLVLGVTGIYLVFCRNRRRRVPPLMISLVVSGPLGWIVTAPVIITPGSNMVFRAWPFLMIGMSMYCALALVALVGWLRGTIWLGHLTIAATVTLLLVGGIGLGDNQAGRFKMAHPQEAAGPEDITPDVISAAKWLESTSGRYHMIAADFSSESTFVTYGFQRSPGWGTWIPFLVPGSDKMLRYMQNASIAYLVVDQRVTQMRPRYPYYYGQEELYQLQQEGFAPESPFPAALLRKLDHLDVVSRIYDDGNIQIYGVDRHLVAYLIHRESGSTRTTTHVDARVAERLHHVQGGHK